jgi:hypothetical protein
MCIFNADVVVGATKVMSAILRGSWRAVGYSNNVSSKRDAIMIIPIPGTDITMHDTTPYSTFLDDMAMRIALEAAKGSRGGVSFDDMKTVGQYRVTVVSLEDLIPSLVNMRQGVPSWAYDLFDAYNGWNFLLVHIKAGQKISNQPFLVTYSQTIGHDQYYFPFMDVHGDENIDREVQRNHILIMGHAQFGDEAQLCTTPNLPDFLQNIRFDGFPVDGRYPNGDIWADFQPNEKDPMCYQVRFVYPLDVPKLPADFGLYNYPAVEVG